MDRDTQARVAPWWLFRLTEAYLARGDSLHAAKTLSRIPQREFVLPHRTAGGWSALTAQEQLGSALTALEARLLVEAGRWDTADELLSRLQTQDWFRSPNRRRVDRLRALQLWRRGEAAAARAFLTPWSSSGQVEPMWIDIAAGDGRVEDALAELERAIDGFPVPGLRNLDELIQAHRLLVELTEQAIAAGESIPNRDRLDLQLTALRSRVERDDPDPPWNVIEAALVAADAYLCRPDAERLAMQCAEQALHIARDRSTILVPKAVRRLVIAALRLGALDAVPGWLAEGLARAEDHEHVGEAARLRGLALWHCAVSCGDVAKAQAAMERAIQATGSMLVDASIRFKIGAALGRTDLLRRAQEIYRSLPWPEREGACLEALGQRRIAEVRYRSFGLTRRVKLLERRTGPPLITAHDDAWTE